MDPISQGCLGAIVPQTALDRKRLRCVTLCGALAGIAPDLDIFIASSTDPLMFLVFHRQFTHALIFIPIGALLVAGTLFTFFRRHVKFKHICAACLLGYTTHGLLDACTSYGTQLFWPFTDLRIAWNIVSVVDPAFTLPLLIGVIAGMIWKRRWPALCGLIWVTLYLSLGVVQNQRAVDAGKQLALQRGHEPRHLTVKPSIANQLVWRSIYMYENAFYIDAIRVGLHPNATVCGSGSLAHTLNVERDLPWLKPSQQLIDVDRFSWFSQGYVALDPDAPNRIIDVRYSTLPNQLNALWAIDLDPSADSHAHVRFENLQQFNDKQLQLFFTFLRGENCRSLESI